MAAGLQERSRHLFQRIWWKIKGKQWKIYSVMAPARCLRSVDPVNREIEERLENERKDCKELMFDYNHCRPGDQDRRLKILKELLGSCGNHVYIEDGLHMSYGKHVYLGDYFYANFNLTIWI